MKSLIAIFLVSILPVCAAAQTRLDAPELEQTISSDEFSDVVKLVWDEIKKGVETYSTDQKSKSEFETTSAFEARMRRRQEQITSDIQQFLTTKKISQRKFAVLMKADLLHYNADTQTYTVRSNVEILIPPKTEELLTVCPSNPYISIREQTKDAYKFAYLTMDTKTAVHWQVNSQTAQNAKSNKADVFFKVWFRFDVSSSPGEHFTLKIVPEKIALVAERANTTYWKEDIAH
jgi:hypothetical protein